MKIIHFSTSLSRSAGGLYYSVSGLARAQAALGHDVQVFGGADGSFNTDRHIWGELPLVTMPIASAGYGFSLSMLRALRAARPEILHVHGVWSSGSIYGVVAALLGTATVVSPRGMLDPWILARKPIVKRIHGILFERPMLRRSLAHALNESEKHSILDYMRPEKACVFIAPNGVELRDVAGVKKDGSALYIGRLHEKKQVIELIGRWRESTFLKGRKLVIAGWGAEEYEADVKRACEGAENVEFVGSAYGSAKTTLLERASYFILPSLSEGLPMAVLEGLASACIPIITDGCNLPELFASDAAIHLETDFSNFAAVAERIVMATGPELETGREKALHAAQAYAWPAIAAATVAQYAKFLDLKATT